MRLSVRFRARKGNTARGRTGTSGVRKDPVDSVIVTAVVDGRDIGVSQAGKALKGNFGDDARIVAVVETVHSMDGADPALGWVDGD